MSALVPNLDELHIALHDGTDADHIAAAFDTDDLPTARVALRTLLAIWEQQAGEVAARALGEGDGVRVLYLEVWGFRSFGSASQRVELTAPLAVVHADNSQGKTSLAEAVEFLYTGATTRRLLLGGSPSEFQDALRNAHLPVGSPVYVELGLDDGSGATRVLRRELICDYRGASDCTSTLTLDGSVVDSVVEAGLALSDPPLAAPVLIEHTLRYAVSAKPGERSDYFKAVLEVAALLTEREAGPRSPLLSALAEVAAIPLFTAAVDPLRSASALPAVERALLTACHAAASPPDTADDDHQSAEGNTEPLPIGSATSCRPGKAPSCRSASSPRRPLSPARSPRCVPQV